KAIRKELRSSWRKICRCELAGQGIPNLARRTGPHNRLCNRAHENSSWQTRQEFLHEFVKASMRVGLLKCQPAGLDKRALRNGREDAARHARQCTLERSP